MGRCAVCGNNVSSLGGDLIKGKSGETVCRKCLKKANISVMKFAYTDIPAGQIMGEINQKSIGLSSQQSNAPQQTQAKFCQNCGSKVEGSFCSNCGTAVNNVQVHSVSSGNVGMHCPRCKSTELQIISDVKAKGVSATNLCLCGLLGLAGAGKTKTTHYWVCSKCGNKFKA